MTRDPSERFDRTVDSFQNLAISHPSELRSREVTLGWGQYVIAWDNELVPGGNVRLDVSLRSIHEPHAAPLQLHRIGPSFVGDLGSLLTRAMGRGNKDASFTKGQATTHGIDVVQGTLLYSVEVPQAGRYRLAVKYAAYPNSPVEIEDEYGGSLAIGRNPFGAPADALEAAALTAIGAVVAAYWLLRETWWPTN